VDDIEIIEKACEIHLDLQLRGLTIQEQDIFIAATAITRGLILVSNDSDLQRVQGLNLENWLVES
jgi:tRNA(fMet)-specific endonuclease VapC